MIPVACGWAFPPLLGDVDVELLVNVAMTVVAAEPRVFKAVIADESSTVEDGSCNDSILLDSSASSEAVSHSMSASSSFGQMNLHGEPCATHTAAKPSTNLDTTRHLIVHQLRVICGSKICLKRR
jgi:hypothetical protein